MRVGSTSANGFTLVGTTQFWNVWSTAAFHSQHAADFDAPRMSWLDASYRELVDDLGFQLTPQRGRCYDGEHLDVVLDPAAQGGAHTGTTFGSSGVSVSPDALYNIGNGITRVLVVHPHDARDSQRDDGVDTPRGGYGRRLPDVGRTVAVPQHVRHGRRRGGMEKGRLGRSASEDERRPGGPPVPLDPAELGWAPYQRLFQWTRLKGLWTGTVTGSRRSAPRSWFGS